MTRFLVRPRSEWSDRLRRPCMVHPRNNPQMVDHPFQSQEYIQFLSNWGICCCLSLAYYAQSNGQAEVAVKTAKCILLDNTDSAGGLDYDQTARAFLMHRNTPIQDLGLSPAMMLFGHSIKDHLPTLWQNMSI